MGGQVEIFRGAAVPGRREFYEAVLRNEGIPFLVRSEGGLAEHPVTVGPMGEFIIVVSEEHAAQAKDVLEEVEASANAHGANAEDENEGEPIGLLSKARRPPSPTEKRAALVGGILLFAAGVTMMLQYPSPIVVFGGLFILASPLLVLYARQ